MHPKHTTPRLKRSTKKMPVTERFWKYISPGAFDECWPWRAYCDKHGYGHIGGENRVTAYAHRLSWEIHFGPIPDGLWVLHKCDNPSCCNPYHLFLGTNQDNMDDMVKKNRQARHGKNKGERVGTSKLTEDQVREIRRRFDQGERQIDLAKEIGTDKGTIWQIVHRKSWRHI